MSDLKLIAKHWVFTRTIVLSIIVALAGAMLGASVGVVTGSAISRSQETTPPLNPVSLFNYSNVEKTDPSADPGASGHIERPNETNSITANSTSLQGATFVQVSREVPASLIVRPVTQQPGNCNGDESVSSADMTAVVLEIFDGDGDALQNVSNGTFPGTVGCDANKDGLISAADITCVVLIIFEGQGSCKGPA